MVMLESIKKVKAFGVQKILISNRKKLDLTDQKST